MEAKALSVREANDDLKVEWDKSRGHILEAIAKTLARSHRSQWIPASNLLPDGFHPGPSWKTICSEGISIECTSIMP